VAAGAYGGSCHVNSNDPLTPVVNKPYIKVRVTAPIIGVNPDSLYHSQLTNTVVTYNNDFAIGNTGDGNLLISSATNTLAWISLIGIPGMILPAGSSLIGLNVNTTGITPGTYLDSVTINSNDPTRPIFRKPKIVIQVTQGQVESLFWKDYNEGLPEGYMPDFDQNQDFNGDLIVEQAYCGPTAVANSFWWFQGKYPTKQIVPPTLYPGNPVGFVQMLAALMKTNTAGGPGTYVDSMFSGIKQYMQVMHLDSLFYAHKIVQPSFDTIAAELIRCQDVTLLVGIWLIEDVMPGPQGWLVNWRRVGGHYVTVAGITELNGLVGISDPDADNFEMGISSGVRRGTHHGHPAGHNDGVSASHDIYNVGMPACSPGGIWELDHPYWQSQYVMSRYNYQNGGSYTTVVPWPCQGIVPVQGMIYSEIEAAVIVSPKVIRACDYKPGDINGDHLVGGGDVTYGVRFFKLIGNRPPDSCWNDSTQAYLYSAGDVNGNCEFRGSDITWLVAYFKLINPTLKWCRWTPPLPSPALKIHQEKNATEPVRILPSILK
jgi:hypothetical protein